jgi:hypothetical protein
VSEDRFRTLLERHIRARMAADGLSYQNVSEECGLQGRNYVWRAATPEADVEYRIKGPENLGKLLDWLELEPRDFAQADTAAKPGHITDAIIRLAGVTVQQRRQLVDVVNAFLQAANKE